jgi:hypothetical protein
LRRHLPQRDRLRRVKWPLFRSSRQTRSAALPLAIAARFTEVVVAAEPSEQVRTDVPVLAIELGRNIRVRIAATAPTELATAIIKALSAR